MSADPWGLSSGPPIRETLRRRAMRREIEFVGPEAKGYLWVVFGEPKLGDQYGEYKVVGPGGGSPRDYTCDCQSHGGGQYRRQCSHIVRAIIWWEENADDVEWAEEERAQVGGEVARTEGVSVVEESFLRDPPGTAQRQLEALAARDRERENEPYSDAGDGEDEDYEEQETVATTTVPSISILDHILTEIDNDGDNFTPDLINALTPTQPPLPAKYTDLRPQQIDAILECIEAFEDEKKVVFLSAPTGTGKTLIGEIVGRFFGHRTYTCTTKSLQAQILRDFDYAKLLMGRANYQTRDNPDVTCDSCTKNHSEAACWTCGNTGKGHCAFCHPVTACPYSVAKYEAKMAHLSVLNTAYLVREMRSMGSIFVNQPLFILDEADALEEQLMGFIQVELGPRLRKKLGVGLPDLKGKEESWVEWVEQHVLPAARLYLANLKSTLFTMQADPKVMKELDRAGALVERLEWLLQPVEGGDDPDSPNLATGWVMDVQGQSGRWKKGGGGDSADITIVFKPIKVDRYARDILWEKGPRFLLMSATMISPSQMAEDLGLEREEWTVVEVESSFEIERRPIIVQSIVSVTKKNEDEARPLIVDAVDEIMANHPKDRILVHTVSYPNTLFLMEHLSDHRRLHSYNHAWEREGALGRFLKDDNGVLLAPSFERGIDLHGDDCRVIVIAKAPYPFLGDAQVNARLYRTGISGKRWYAARTIRDICQMTGRAMRSEEDWCISYILDAQFNKLYRENRTMFPKWWEEALVWDVNDPKWRQALEDIYEGRLIG